VHSLGNGKALSAVAPSQRPGRRQSIQNIRERYSDYSPGPETWTLNIPPLGQFRPAPRVSVSAIHIPQQCGPFATYRCITACRSDN
jgi:hypothetical protein